MRAPRHNEVTVVARHTYMVYQEDPMGRRALRFIKALPDGTEVTGFTIRDMQLGALKRLQRWAQEVIDSNSLECDMRRALDRIGPPDPVIMEQLALIDSEEPLDG